MKLIAIIGILWLSMWTPGHSQFNGCAAGFCGASLPAPLPTTTFDPAHLGTSVTLSSGNLVAQTPGTGSVYAGARSTTSHSTGKYYAEVAFSAISGGGGQYNPGIQNASESMSSYLGFTVDSDSGGVFGDTGNFYVNSSVIGTGAGPWGNTPVVSFAFDASGAGLFWFSLNGGSWNNNGSANPDTGVGGFSLSGVTGPFYFAIRLNDGTGTVLTATVNFGATPYTYKTGFGNVTTFGNW